MNIQSLQISGFHSTQRLVALVLKHKLNLIANQKVKWLLRKGWIFELLKR